MKEPWFWRDRSVSAQMARALLAPVSGLYDAGGRLRSALTKPHAAGVPVICIGAASIGGAGKTPFALMFAEKLRLRGKIAHFATRGYGGALTGPVRVNDNHCAEDVGDEALLLAAAAATFVAKDRLAGARAAAPGADLVIMDDGFQNPGVKKDFSILLLGAGDVDKRTRVFPAGPLREPLDAAIARADAIILAGVEIVTGAGEISGAGKPVFRATTQIVDPPAPGRAVAFSGIANPGRFFASLEAAGMTLAGRFAFADHHPFTSAEISKLKSCAAKENAALITTEKDFMRIARDMRDDILTLRIRTELDDADRLVDLVLEKIGSSR